MGEASDGYSLSGSGQVTIHFQTIQATTTIGSQSLQTVARGATQYVLLIHHVQIKKVQIIKCPNHEMSKS